MNKMLLKMGGVLTLTALAFSSCSSDIEEPAINGNGDLYTFELQLPADLQTRNAYNDGQYGDGTKATSLHFAIYEIGGQANPVYTEADIDNPTAFFSGKQSNKVTLRLVNGRQYEMICWADVPGNTYYKFNEGNNKSVTVVYTDLEGNCENRDAFYGYAKIAANGAVTGAVSQEIVLTRPFAQVNLGTDDIDNKAVVAAYGKDMKIQASVDLNYNTLNLVDGKVTADPTAGDLVFKPTAIPAADYKFPYEPTKYTYTNMAYVLVPEDRDAINVKYTFFKGTEEVTSLDVTNVPVQRNYRTNIFGSIFTSPAELTITIDPIFTEPDINKEIVSVSSSNEMRAALQAGNDVELENDIVLDGGNTYLVPVGKSAKIKLNGNTLTMDRPQVGAGSNLTIDGGGDGKVMLASTATQFVGGMNVQQGTLTIENAKIETSDCDGIYAQKDGKLIIRNCELSGDGFGICTNASSPYKCDIELYDSKILTKHDAAWSTVGLFFNVEGTVKAENCEFDGKRCAVLMRGGTGTFKNCTFTYYQDNSDPEWTIDQAATNLHNANWGSGDMVPCAAVVAGNRGTSYQYPTDITFTNCTFKVADECVASSLANKVPAMYVYANQGTGLGVKVTIDDASKNNSNGAFIYASDNITVNGVATKTN